MSLDWTVDYGEGPIAVELPHVWHLHVPVAWEGPAVYRTRFQVPEGSPHMVFHGVSYCAEVTVNGELVKRHLGIWDAFAVDLTPWSGSEAKLAVRVTKNGGPSFPVKQVASGFLPYVYQTFGGIFRPVELVDGVPNLAPPAPSPRVRVCEGRIFADDRPFYGRGILTWGWNPETAHPHPPLDVIRLEIDQIEAMGFNLVKFCLWMPPHEYLEELNQRGLWAWLELPIWLPATDSDSLATMREECLRIVAQYRRHSNILAWTAGCELSEGIAPDWRRDLVEDIRRLTGHPLIKDNSGGAEMYGGHPAEFGDFEDFHPYCDPPFYPGVVASLAAGVRSPKPILLGEFNDYDVFRPVHRWVQSPPYWASPDPDLNAQGVRWQHDLPRILEECRTTDLGPWLAEREDQLLRSSLSQSAWMRQRAFDATRLAGFDGWVLTGHRHTPISSAGVVDDGGGEVYPLETVRAWTADTSLMLFPRRTPPWIDGGNRPGWEPTTVRFAGPCGFQVAVHSVRGETAPLEWAVPGIAAGVCDPATVPALEPREVGRFVVDLEPGTHRLDLRWGNATRSFRIRVAAPESGLDDSSWVANPGTLPRPFFREACYSWEHPTWQEFEWVDDWDRLVLVSGDRALDPSWLDREMPGWHPALVRLDTRTFERLPIVAVSEGRIATTLRPAGGLGDQPIGLDRNPAGQDLIRVLHHIARSGV